MNLLVLVSVFTLTLGASILGPPKLLVQPPEEVWFQLDDATSSPSARPTLKCQASENAETFTWFKNGIPLKVGGDIEWLRPGQSGSLTFLRPQKEHQGYYQCFVANVFGTAVSNKVHLQLGVLEHFPPRPIRRISVAEGESLTVECKAPKGHPSPSIFWLYRNESRCRVKHCPRDTEQDSVIETIKRRHIAVDEEGRLQFTSVEKHDGRTTLLYECAASSPVLHGEYRSGDKIQLEVLPAKNNGPIPVHKLYFSPDEITVKAGGRLKIQCIFGGRPTPTVFWSKIDGDLPKMRMKDLTSADSDFGKSLIIDNVHPEDAGRYECRANQLTHTVNVRVLAAPYWDIEAPRDVEQPEESTTELECLASGQPPPIIRWSMNGKPLHELGDDPRRMLLDDGRILRLKNLNHDLDTGVYQCNASNPLGYVYANAFVNVKAHAPRFLMPTQRIWKVVLRSDVELNCDVEAAPDPIVRWVDADDRTLQIVEGKTKLYPNHTFVIHDVNSADEGLYYCNVSNKYGINRATNKLQVFKPTYFVKIPSPKRLSVEAGDPAELFCEAVSDPRLPIQYKWTINGKIINNGKNFEILPDRLKIRAARGRHAGIIDCAAITDVDVKLASMQLIVKDAPAPPPVDAVLCSERKAIIMWKPSDEHGDHIKKYIVEMQTDFKKDHWEKVVEEINVNRDTFEADITLTPWVNYTFRVIAENSHGRSDSVPPDEDSEPQVPQFCQTRPSFPYTNPANVVAEGTEPDNLVIRWTPMDKYYWNAPHLQYLIRYKLNDEHSAWTEFVVEDSLANHTIIREQPTFKEFLVQVRAVNAMGPSILDPETIKGYSGEDIPEAPPANPKVHKMPHFASLNFSWDPVTPESSNGFFMGYEIEYWKTDSPQRKSKILVAPNNTHKVLSNFAANTNYTAVMRTKNKHHASVASEPIHFETPEGIPSKVNNLRVYAVGALSILVLWEPPLQPNGQLRGYFLSFTNDQNDTEETYVLHKNHHYLHENSVPETGYKVSVWAETGAGEGPRVMRPVRTWPAKDPDAPSFKVTNVSIDCMDIEWLPANRSIWKMPGSAFYINYSLADSEEYKQSQMIYLPTTTLRISNLSESSKYLLSGVARDGPRMTHSQPSTVSTLSRESLSALKQDSLRNAAWFVAVLCAVGIALLTILVTCCCEERKGGKYSVRRKEIEIGHQLDNEEERRFIEYQYGFKS